MNKCKGIKKNGEKCRYKAKQQGYCGIHLKNLSTFQNKTKIKNSNIPSVFVHKSKSSKNNVKITKILGLDMDGTLIKFDKIHEDTFEWLYNYDKMKNILKNYIDKGWELVIFTNQGGVQKNKVLQESIERRIRNVAESLDLPISVFASFKYDYNRKPHIGMWNLALENLGIKFEDLDLSQCLYVGDAAGREKGWDKKDKNRKDFSCSDRKFANNIGINFRTPEEFFLNCERENKWTWNCFDPRKYIQEYLIQEYRIQECDENNSLCPKKDKEIIILVGCPGSGKSTLAKTKFQEYVWINRDTLKTKEKCYVETRKAMSEGKSVIIDNTNPDKETRRTYISIAREFSYFIRIIVMNVDKTMARHLDQMRISINKLSKGVPTIALNIFFKKFRESGPPTLTECDLIENYYIKPSFDDDDHKKYFMMLY